MDLYKERMSAMSAISLDESVKEVTYELSEDERREIDAIGLATEDVARALLLYCELVKKGKECGCLTVVKISRTGSDEDFDKYKYHFSKTAFNLLGIEDNGSDYAKQVRYLLDILQAMGVYEVRVYSPMKEDRQRFYLAKFELTERRLHKPVASVSLGKVPSKLDLRREILPPAKKRSAIQRIAAAVSRIFVW